MDCFTIGFVIPNLFRRLFGEGALSVALIPVYTETLQEDRQKADRLARSVMTLLLGVLAVITLLGLGLIYLSTLAFDLSARTEQVLILTAIMLPYMILICTVATLGGLLNVHRFFFSPAIAPVVLNLSMIVAVFILQRHPEAGLVQQSYQLGFSVVIAGVLQCLVQWPSLKKAGIPLKPRIDSSDPGLRKIFKLMLPMLVGLSAMQINTCFDWLIAFVLTATEQTGSHFELWGRSIAYPIEEGAVSCLYMSQRLYQFPLGVFGIALATAIFPHLSDYASRHELSGFSKTMAQGIRMVVFISFPALIGLIMVRTPLIQSVFEGRESRFTAVHTQLASEILFYYALGIGAYFLQQLIARGFYSFKDSTTPVKVAVWFIGINFILNLILIWPLGAAGLALGTAITATLQVLILLKCLMKKYQLKLISGLSGALIKTIISSVGMVVGCQIVLFFVGQISPIIEVMLIVLVSVILYSGISWVLKSSELSALLKR